MIPELAGTTELLLIVAQYPGLLGVAALLLALCLLSIRRRRSRAREAIHVRRRREAARQLNRLLRMKSASKQLAHLKTVNPYVFEEMILTALQRRGHRVVRNLRYSHDGGIDGQALIRGRHYLIQAKRYNRHINPAHVEHFVQICRKRRRRGLFVHTGVVSERSTRIARKGRVEIIGDEYLLKILLRRRRWIVERV